MLKPKLFVHKRDQTVPTRLAGTQPIRWFGPGILTLTSTTSTTSGNFFVTGGTLQTSEGNLDGPTALGQNNTINITNANLKIGVKRGAVTGLGLSASNNVTLTNSNLDFYNTQAGNAYDGCYIGNIVMDNSSITSATGDGPRFNYTYGLFSITTNNVASTISAPIFLVYTATNYYLNLNLNVNLTVTSGFTDFPAIGGVWVEKLGSADLVLSGTSNYAGDTDIYTGRILCASTNSLSPNSVHYFYNASGSGLNIQSFSQTLYMITGGGATGGHITGNSNAILSLNSSIASTFSGNISGAMGLTKLGSNTFTLSGTNTNTFTTRVQAGVLRITSQSNLSASPIDLAGGTFSINAGNVTLSNNITTVAGTSIVATNQTTAQTTTLSGVIAGSNTMTVSTQADTSNSGGGAAGLGLRWTGLSNTFSGVINLSSGLISRSDASSFGTASFNMFGGGILTSTTQTITNAIAVGSTGFLRCYGSATATYSGLISGSGTLTRTDGGTINWTNTGNTFSGPIIVGGGILSVVKIAGTQTITINAGTTFRKSGTTAMVFSGVFSGSGTLDLAHTSGDTEFNQTNTTFTGPVTKTSTGTVRVQGTNPLGTGTITTSASFTLASRSSGVAVTVPNAIVIGAGTTMSVDGGWNTVTLSGILSGATGNINGTSSGLVVISNASNTSAGLLQAQTSNNATTMVNGKWNGTATARSAGILAGLGNVTGLVTVASGGKIQGGDFNPTAVTYTTTNAVGTLTLNGGLDFAAQASRLLVRTNGTTLTNLVAITGTLTAASGFTVDILNTLDVGVYTLISNTGTLPVTLPTLGTNSSGRTVVFSWVPGTGLVATLT